MYPFCGYIAQVTNLSPQATEKDVHRFFSHCGIVELVEITRYAEDAITAYVTFRDAYALEMAVLLSGATIVDQTVWISMYGVYLQESNNLTQEDHYSSVTVTQSHADAFVSSPREAITVAQQVVKKMISEGYTLSKDVIIKARALDESPRFISFVRTKLLELGDYIGLTPSIQWSLEAVRSADDKYHFTDFTKSAVIVTGTAAVAAVTISGKVAAAAATSVMNSPYFSSGLLKVSDALDRAAKAARDMGGGGSH